MKIIIELPRESEAKVTYSEKDRRLTIEPKFRAPNSIQSFLYGTVLGNSGATKRFVTTVGGATGKVVVNETTDVEAIFDRPDAEQAAAAVADGEAPVA